MASSVVRNVESAQRNSSLREHRPETGLRLVGNATVGPARMILEAASTGTKGVVLVVERDPVARNVACQELTRYGYMVLEAADCRQAIVIMQECGVPV